MAYTIIFTKESVNKISNVLYKITINVSVSDAGQEIFNNSFSVQYNSNAPDLEKLKLNILQKVQGEWDKYIAEKGIFDSQAFDNAISAMQTTANNYINQ